MNKLPKPRFNLKSPKAQNETLVLLIFRYIGKKLQYSTGLSIKPSDWSKQNNRAILKERRADLILLNQEIEKLTSHCTEIYIEHDYGIIGIDEFKNKLNIRTGRKPDDSLFNSSSNDGNSPFFDFVEKEIKELKAAKMKRKSLEPLETHGKILREFGEYYDKRRFFTFEDVDWNFRLKLIDWLAGRNVQLAYGNKTLTILRRFLDSAKRQKLHNNTDYQGLGWVVTRKKAKGQVVIFSESELNKLAILKLTGKLDRIRDICLIGAGTGQRFSDFSKYKPEQFSSTFNGIPLISVISDKTDTPAKIPLNIFPWLIPVLEKHGYSTPQMHMENYNKGIKELAKMAGFDEKVLVVKQYMSLKARVEKSYIEKHKLVSSHLCRRSFATNLYRMGFRLTQIMPMTGHSTESQLRNYIGIDNEQNAEQIGMMFIQKNQHLLQVARN